MTRYTLCETILRAVYGEQPNDDSNITVNLVNQWLNNGISLATKLNYKENLQIDGVTYVNNSFYTTFRGLVITSTAENFLYQLTLPQIPLGIGRTEGIGTLQFVDVNGFVTDNAIPISENQVGYFNNMRTIPNKTLYYPEGQFLYMISTEPLDTYTGKVRMISGGDSTNINSILNVPDDYLDTIIRYCSDRLKQERAQPKVLTNSGVDVP